MRVSTEEQHDQFYDTAVHICPNITYELRDLIAPGVDVRSHSRTVPAKCVCENGRNSNCPELNDQLQSDWPELKLIKIMET